MVWIIDQKKFLFHHTVYIRDELVQLGPTMPYPTLSNPAQPDLTRFDPTRLDPTQLNSTQPDTTRPAIMLCDGLFLENFNYQDFEVLLKLKKNFPRRDGYL